MSRGSTLKSVRESGFVLERRMVTRRYWFEWKKDKCIGCATCVAVCPKEALELRPGVVENGRITTRPGIEINADKCVYCGECVALCPTYALTMSVNDQPENPVMTWETFPKLIRSVAVQPKELEVKQAVACIEACPTDVISPDGRAGMLKVDESGCIYCHQCEALAPEAFSVVSPWEGFITLDVSLCPSGCRACVDICPSGALTWGEDNQVHLDKRFCLYCGACQNICPVPGAITVERASIRHQPIKSAAWTAALEKLISVEAAAREMENKSQAKRRQAARFLPGAGK